MKIFGVDPGVSGGLALLDSETMDFDFLERMSSFGSEEDLSDFLCREVSKADIFAIEDIPKYIGEDRPGSSTAVLYGNFKFSLACAFSVKHILHKDLLIYRMVPLKWMNLLIPLRKRERERSKRKKQLQEEAKRIFPEVGKGMTLSVCDAALIALAGFKQWESTVGVRDI